MASKTRGEHVKGDVAGATLLRRIPTTAVVRAARQALYYELLNNLDFASLSALEQPLAILYAQKFCEILDIVDSRTCRNQADIERKIAARLDLTTAYTQLLNLYKALHTTSQQRAREQSRTETNEAERETAIDLQSLLSNATSDNDE